MSSAASYRIIHVFPNAARLSCGPCNAVMAFMECQLEQGMDVGAISPADPHIPEASRQPIEHLPIEEFDFAGNYRERALKMSGPKPAVFHFHGIERWMDELAAALDKNSIPYVFTSHGQLHFHSAVHAAKKLAYLNVVNPFIRRAAGLHFLTQREARRSRFILPLYRKPLLIQANLIQPPDAQKIVPASRAAHGIPADAFVYAYLGRLDVRHKGLDLLVKAFAGVASGHNSRLLLIGPDFKGGREFLQQLARQENCEDKVIFAGPKTGRAKWEFLKMADAFVSPSRWEALGISQVEAIGLGLPTIVSDKFNIAPEMLTHGAALVARLDAGSLAAEMRRLRENAALRVSLANAGGKWVKEFFTSASAAPRFKKFYEAVLSGR